MEVSVLKRATCQVVFGSAGWLPADARTPLTESTSLVLLIRRTPDGFFLESTSSNPHYRGGDTWHPSCEAALAQAQHQFGVSREAWADIAA